MMLPQRPYFPIGSLHGAIAYPGETAGFSAEQVAWSSRPGTASIHGTVAAVGYNCAGGKVVLTPDAPFSRRRIRNL